MRGRPCGYAPRLPPAPYTPYPLFGIKEAQLGLQAHPVAFPLLVTKQSYME